MGRILSIEDAFSRNAHRIQSSMQSLDVSGAMARTMASFKTNGQQMADAIKNIGAVDASANVPLQKQLAVLGQLQTTMPGSAAGTLYKAFMMKAAEAGQSQGGEGRHRRGAGAVAFAGGGLA